jgi:porphobilinogen synthase
MAYPALGQQRIIAAMSHPPVHVPIHLPVRPRRLRAQAALRDGLAEVSLRPSDFILPLFVVPGQGERQAIASLPGIDRLSLDVLLPEVERALGLGIRGIMLFAVLGGAEKDATASRASDPQGLLPSTIRALRQAFGNAVVVYSDVCLCTHTDHGHCGLLRSTARGLEIDNDATLPQLAAMALAHAEAGVDFVAPSDMMDGRVGYIRGQLDAQGHGGVGILAYSVKYASAFYGPFREAAASAPAFGDRASYQLDPRNRRDAPREAALDEAEGADLLMVKPALAYLDVIARLRPHTNLPLVAYNVSGEYAMLKAAAQLGAIDEPKAVRETLTAIKRAGSDLVVSYHALEACAKGWL